MNHVRSVSEAVLDRPSFSQSLRRLVPGILLCGAIAGAAILLNMLPVLGFFSPMIVAVIAGITLNALNLVPSAAQAGMMFSARSLLRFAVILLGFQITWGQIQSVGLAAATIIIFSLVVTLVATIAFGKILGVDRKLTQLIAAGTSICGASAIVAANTVTRASDEDVAYAIACITFCGMLAMFVFPALIPFSGLKNYQYGLWTGAAVHEVGQVVGAAFQGGQTAGEFGTIAKLTRVMFLVPVIFALGIMNRRFAAVSMETETLSSSPQFPVFIALFLGVVTCNSFIPVSADVKSIVGIIATVCLTMSLAAIGLGADARKLRERGVKPLLLGIFASVLIAVISFGLLKLLT